MTLSFLGLGQLTRRMLYWFPKTIQRYKQNIHKRPYNFGYPYPMLYGNSYSAPASVPSLLKFPKEAPMLESMMLPGSTNNHYQANEDAQPDRNEILTIKGRRKYRSMLS